jgi:hypothetical protein
MQKDYKHVAALQEDQLNEAIARYRRNQGAEIEFRMNVITLNEWRELNNDDPLDGELGDKYYYELIEMGIVFGQGTGGSNNPEISKSKSRQWKRKSRKQLPAIITLREGHQHWNWHYKNARGDRLILLMTR